MSLRSFSASCRTLIQMVLWLLFILCAARLQAQDTSTQFWPKLDVYLKLNEESRLYFFYSATKTEDQEAYAEGSVGGYFDFYGLPVFRPLLRKHPDAARSKLLMIRAGYSFSRKTSDITDHSPTIEAQGSAPLPWGLLLSDRNRVDFRFVGGNYQPRYRNRLKLDRTFEAGRLHLTPYGYAEVFYDWNVDKFNRYRFAAGSDVALGRHVIFEGYYLRQRDTTSSPQYINAIGVTLQLYFP